jgi:hypothetical protein
MSIEYFEPVKEIPIRSNVKLFADILQRFLDSKFKLVKMNSKLFENNSHLYRTTALHRYVKVHNIPIRVYCINDEIYLEKS